MIKITEFYIKKTKEEKNWNLFIRMYGYPGILSLSR